MTRLHATHPLVQVETDASGTPIRLRLDGTTHADRSTDPDTGAHANPRADPDAGADTNHRADGDGDRRGRLNRP